MPQELSTSDIKETFEDWSMYEAVIGHNYMCHRELARALKAMAAEVAGPLRIVDLGCGDAWLATQAFRNAAVAEYQAADLSASAVERARCNTASWAPGASLYCGNLADFVATQPDGSSNFVLASNSLHHFSTEAKAAIVRHIFRCLAPQGIFCWIDPVRGENETRDTYLTRLTNNMQHDWIGLTKDQRRRAVKHVWESDYPETESCMCHQCDQAGFQPAGRFLQHDLFGAWKFNKP